MSRKSWKICDINFINQKNVECISCAEVEEILEWKFVVRKHIYGTLYMVNSYVDGAYTTRSEKICNLKKERSKNVDIFFCFYGKYVE